MTPPPTSYERIAFVASSIPEAKAAHDRLGRRYGDVPPTAADVIVALGGDGLMLQTLRQHLKSGTPIYGMNRGSVGFLMNEYSEEDLVERLTRAEATRIHPLRMDALDAHGRSHTDLAFNEVSLLRQTKQAAHVRVSLNGVVKLEELVCDGVLVSTTAGSTAYNLSAHGPILPLGSQLLALTPISPFRPRRWRGPRRTNC